MDGSVGHIGHVDTHSHRYTPMNVDGAFFAVEKWTNRSTSPLSTARGACFMASVRLSCLILLIGMGPVFTSHSQEHDTTTTSSVPDTLGQRIATAFERGSAQVLLDPAADRVEMSLLGTQTIYSNAQAFYVLQAFLERHPPVGLALIDVSREDQSCFVRGRFEHRHDERTFQVYVQFVKRKEAWQVREIRINEDAT